MIWYKRASYIYIYIYVYIYTYIYVLGKRRDNFLSPSRPLQKEGQQKYRYRTSSQLENSALEINNVTNVTTVLSEKRALDKVSRSSLQHSITYSTWH